MFNNVLFEVRDHVAVIKLNNPPVNALSAQLRADIDVALAKVIEDAAIIGVVITAEGKIFVAGADITEFGKPALPPVLTDIIMKLRQFSKPVVAAINGVAFGGGAELALACTARIAGSKAQIGLPEINLGLVPGAGGLQFLPALIGAAKTFEMASSGKPLSASAAYNAGVICRVVDDHLVDEAIEEVKKLVAFCAVKPIDNDAYVSSGDKVAFEALVEKTKKSDSCNPGIEAIIDIMRAGFHENFEENLKRTRRHFSELVTNERSKAMRYAFFAERAAAKTDFSAAVPVELHSVAIIGAGTMGAGIAMACASKGYLVTLIETNPQALERGFKKIADTYHDLVKRGRLSEQDGEKCINAIKGEIGLEYAAHADLVIEATFEDINVKKDIFKSLDNIAKQGAILATNTSYLDVNLIGSVTNRPENVLGLHFFSPANIMRLVEVVRTQKTTPAVLSSTVNFARKIGKIPVVVGVCYGFVGNRMLAQRTRAAERILQDCALPWQVDKALTDFGFRMGPFAVSDLAGLDIGWRNRQATGQVSPIADAICELGHFGQKTGKGYYIYKDGARTAIRDPEIEILIENISKKMGIQRREISDEEIVERLIYPMINEAASIIDENIVSKPSDIDVIWCNGYGWPVWRGGPIYYADYVGLAHIAERLEYYAQELGDPTLRPAPLLQQLAANNGSFEA